MKNKKGFTLVELLIVIAIIGVLSTIAFVSLNRARSKARDAKRIADVRQLQSALELYYTDQPAPEYPWDQAPVGGALISAELSSLYVASIPTSPSPPDGTCTSGQNSYAYTAQLSQGGAGCTDSASDCGWYSMVFCLGDPTGGLQSGLHTASPAGIQ